MTNYCQSLAFDCLYSSCNDHCNRCLFQEIFLSLLLSRRNSFEFVFLELLNIQNSFRSSHRRCSVKKGVLRNFEIFTGKHLCQSLFFNKVAGLRPATLSKKRLLHRCFPVNFATLLRTLFLQNTSERLLLQFSILCSRVDV